MDRLKLLLRFEALLYWRSFHRSCLKGNEILVIFLLVVLGIFRLFTFVEMAANRFEHGDFIPAESLLTGMFLVWVAWWVYSKGPEIPRHFMHMPLSRGDLFLLRISAGLVSPAAWGLIGFSAVLFRAFASVSSQVGFIPACISYLSWCFFSGLALATFRDALISRRGVGLVLLILMALLAGGLGTAWFHSQWAPQHCFRFWIMAGHPWIASGAFFGAAIGLAVLSFFGSRTTQKTKPSPLGRFPFFVSSYFMLGPLPELLLKDLRLISRQLEPWIALLISLQGMVYFLTDKNPHPLALVGGTLVVLSFAGPLTLNSFGLETRRAINRYRVLPISGLAILRSKNNAFFILVLLLLAPMTVCGVFRTGMLPAMAALFSAGMMALLFAIWGNETAIHFPRRCRPYRFAAFGLETGILRGVVTYVFCCTPGILLLMATRGDWGIASAVGAAGVAILLRAYRLRIQGQGEDLEQFLKDDGHFSLLHER